MKINVLEALLIFLAGDKGRSGYDIRLLFQSTPLGIFSDSPGAIYPALARLERRGLLASAAESDGRRRRVFERTRAGAEALEAWLTEPLDRQAARRRPEAIELRFVMTAETLGPSKARAFLRRCAEAYCAELAALEAFLAGPGRTLTRAGKDAVALGIRLCRTRLQWCRDTARDQRGIPHDHRRKAGARN